MHVRRESPIHEKKEKDLVTPDDPREVEQLFFETNFSLLPEQDWKTHYEIGMRHIREMAPDDGLQFFESAMAVGVAEESDLLDFIETMTDDMKRELAQYIFSVMRPGLYIRSFHQCWGTLPYETMVAYMDEANLESPESFPYVAIAFAARTEEETRVRQYRLEKSWYGDQPQYYHSGFRKDPTLDEKPLPKELEKDKNKENIVGNLMVADDIIETCIREAEQGFPNFTTRQCREMVGSYGPHPGGEPLMILLPHLPRLREVGLIDDTFIEAYRREGEDDNWIWTMAGVYVNNPGLSISKERAEQYEKLIRRFQQKYKEEYIDLGRLTVPERQELRKYYSEADTVVMERIIRGMRMNTDVYDAKRQHDVVRSFAEEGESVLRLPELLEMDEVGVRQLFRNLMCNSPVSAYDGSDMAAFMVYARKQGFAGMAEALVVRQLKHFAESSVGLGPYIVPVMIERADEVFGALSEESRDKILRQFFVADPVVFLRYGKRWLDKFDQEFIDRVFRRVSGDPWQSLQMHRHIDRYSTDSDQAARLKDRYRETLRSHIREQGRRILVYRYRDACDLLSQEEVDSEIMDAISSAVPDVEVISAILGQTRHDKAKGDSLRHFIPAIRQLFDTREGLLLEFLRQGDLYEWHILDNFGEQYLLTYYLEHTNGEYFIDEGRCTTYLTGGYRAELPAEQIIARADLLVKQCMSGSFSPSAATKLFLRLGDIIAARKKDRSQQEIRHFSPSRRRELGTRSPQFPSRHQKRFGEMARVTDHLDRLRQHLVGVVTQYAEEHRSAVMDLGLWKYDELNVRGIAREDGYEYVAAHPYKMYDIQPLFDPHEFAMLIREQAPRLAFRGEGLEADEGYIKDKEERRRKPRLGALRSEDPIAEVNPYLRYDGREDYYAYLLRSCEPMTYFPIYQSRLEVLARREYKRTGRNAIVLKDSTKANTEFNAIIRRLCLLESWKMARDLCPAMDALDDVKREEAITLLESIVAAGLEERVERELMSEGEHRYTEVLDVAERILVHNLADSFGIDVPEQADTKLLSPELIRVLTVYRRHIRKDEDMDRSSRIFLERVLSGTFHTWRTWGTNYEPHSTENRQAALATLQRGGLLPEQLSLDQYESWVTDTTGDFEEDIEFDMDSLRLGIRDVIDRAVIDGHADAGIKYIDTELVEEKLRALKEPIFTISQEIKALKEQYPALTKKRLAKEQPLPSDVLEQYGELISARREYMIKNQSDIDARRAELVMSKLRNLTEQDIRFGQITVGGERIAFQTVFGTTEKEGLLKQYFLNRYPQLAEDIDKIEQLIEEYTSTATGDRVSRKSLHITDAVDLEVYMKIGDKPVPSCQNYSSGGSNNYGLLSYVTDPNVKIMQMKDDDGRIIARSVLRLLEDQDGKPALFMERVYAVQVHAKIEQALTRAAKEKAARMGVNLYVIPSEVSEASIMDETVEDETELQSRGSRSGCVYTDAGGGKAKEGKYTIRHALPVKG